MSIKLSNILNEVKINKPATYKYKLGQKIPGSLSMMGVIIDRIPNGHNVPGGYEVAKGPELDDPCYLIQWCYPNQTCSSGNPKPHEIWFSEKKLTDLINYRLQNEVKINNPDPYKYKVGEIVRELYGDEESCKILDRRPNWTAV
jgi:hypothetical protein